MLIKDLLGISKAVVHPDLLFPSESGSLSLTSQESRESGSSEELSQPCISSSAEERQIPSPNINLQAASMHQILRQAMLHLSSPLVGAVPVPQVVSWFMQNMGKFIDGCWTPLPKTSVKRIRPTIYAYLARHNRRFIQQPQSGSVKSYSLNPLAPLSNCSAVDFFYPPGYQMINHQQMEDLIESAVHFSDPYEHCVSSDPSEPDAIKNYVFGPQDLDPSLQDVAWIFAGTHGSNRQGNKKALGAVRWALIQIMDSATILEGRANDGYRKGGGGKQKKTFFPFCSSFVHFFITFIDKNFCNTYSYILIIIEWYLLNFVVPALALSIRWKDRSG
jgi:hypothetical protein